jgi:hypothetical protein
VRPAPTLHHLQTRLEALEQHTHTVARQLRWWRGLACGLIGLALLTWALPAVTAQDAQKKKGLEERVAALEDLLMHFSRNGNELFITGANLHIVNGLGRTHCGSEEEPIPDCPNGLGNLIVGYNEPRPEGFENIRTGSHNVVVGLAHNFSRFGGIVVGLFNTISSDFAAVIGGISNTASGVATSVSGGAGNNATLSYAAVSGGTSNTASGSLAVVSGGWSNTADGEVSVVSGGQGNTTSFPGFAAVVSGGRNRTAAGEFDWVAGSLFEDE